MATVPNEVAKSNFQWDYLAVLPESSELDTLPIETPLTGCHIATEGGEVARAQFGRHEDRQLVTDDLLATVAKNFLRRRIHEQDLGVLIDQDNCFGRCLGQESVPLLARSQFLF